MEQAGYAGYIHTLALQVPGYLRLCLLTQGFFPPSLAADVHTLALQGDVEEAAALVADIARRELAAAAAAAAAGAGAGAAPQLHGANGERGDGGVRRCVLLTSASVSICNRLIVQQVNY